MRQIKRALKTTAALVPLVLGAASPAHGCLVVPSDKQAALKSEQIHGESDPLWGPRAPFQELRSGKDPGGSHGVDCPNACYVPPSPRAS